MATGYKAKSWELASRRLCNALLAIAILCVAPSAILATPSGPGEAAICEEASLYAAERVGVPVEILRALTRTETGRRMQGGFLPWPWTVNMEGEGKWFDTPAEALDYALANHDRGARSFDVGCFQINFKWHGDAFASIEEMFDPYANALYAARFIKQLHDELGSWPAAAGAYHSRSPEFANRYSARFSEILARLDGGTTEANQYASSGFDQTVPESAAIIQPLFAPLVPLANMSGSLFAAVDPIAGGLLTPARGSLF